MTRKLETGNGLPTFKPRLNQVVAERELRLVTKAGKRQKVLVRFGKPRALPDNSDYGCVYQIDGLRDGAITRRIYGVDSIQALELAMKMALVELVSTDAYEDGRLTWLGASDLGLPISEAIRDKVKTDARGERAAKYVAADLAHTKRRARSRRQEPKDR